MFKKVPIYKYIIINIVGALICSSRRNCRQFELPAHPCSFCSAAERNHQIGAVNISIGHDPKRKTVTAEKATDTLIREGYPNCGEARVIDLHRECNNPYGRFDNLAPLPSHITTLINTLTHTHTPMSNLLLNPLKNNHTSI